MSTSNIQLHQHRTTMQRQLLLLISIMMIVSHSFPSSRCAVRKHMTRPLQDLSAATTSTFSLGSDAAGDVRVSKYSGSTATSTKFDADSNLAVSDKFLLGRWVERSGNFVLLPVDANDNEMKKPSGVIHFLGGAFVGAAPHITYRYLLESLNTAGYIIVATPYRLDMDYLRSCDEILAKFDAVAVDLAAQYGPLPVIGLGHSCGALLQTLVTCLFPNAPRAINILISFNNKPVSEAIPGFEDFVVPLSQQIMGEGKRSVGIREAIVDARKAFDKTVDTFATLPLVPLSFGAEVVPFFRQLVETADQVPPLLGIIARGQREFEPSPSDTKEVCKRMYRARRTLLVKFENDALDESVEIEKVLREANTIMRMKRPMVEMEVDLRVMTGTHITPLTQNVVPDPPKNVPLLQPLINANNALTSSVRAELKTNFLKTVDEVKTEILTFLEASIVGG